MYDEEIEKAVKDRNGIIPTNIYSKICNSDQIDHIKADGEWINVWSKYGAYWRIKVISQEEPK